MRTNSLSICLKGILTLRHKSVTKTKSKVISPEKKDGLELKFPGITSCSSKGMVYFYWIFKLYWLRPHNLDFQNFSSLTTTISTSKCFMYLNALKISAIWPVSYNITSITYHCSWAWASYRGDSNCNKFRPC